MLFKFTHHGSNRRGLLAHGNVDALNAGVFLIDNGVNSNRGLTDLAVSNNQFPLTTTNRHHRINGFESNLHRLVNRLPGDNAWGNLFNRIGELSVDRAFAINGVTQRIDHTALKLWTHRDFQNTARATASLTLGELLVIAKHNRANRVSLKVKCQTEDIALKLNHLTVLNLGKSMNSDNTVRYRDDSALVCRLRSNIELRNTLLDDVADF